MFTCKRPLQCAVVGCVIAALYSIHVIYSRLYAAPVSATRDNAAPMASRNRGRGGADVPAPPSPLLTPRARRREGEPSTDELSAVPPPATVARRETKADTPAQGVALQNLHDVAKEDEAWQRASWWNSKFLDAMDRMLDDARAARRNITVASIGGSASAGKITYLHRFADELRKFLGQRTQDTHASKAEVHVFNPSAGQTGSVWGALHMEALIPKDTDIVIWEFAINDMNPESTGLVPAEWHKQAFELFLRRTLALNPNMIIGMVSLWRPHARSCWPCEGDSLSFDHVIDVAACYKATGIFGVDANALGQYLNMDTDEIFKDSHHPTPEMHKCIGDALFTHVQRTSSHRSRDNLDSVFSCKPLAGVEANLSFDMVAFPPRVAHNQLLAAILDMGRPLQSLLYKKPVYGASMANIKQVSSQAVLSSGKNDSSRLDRQRFVELPKCLDGVDPLRFSVGVHRRSLQFLGLNLRGWQGKMLGDPKQFKLAEKLLTVQVVFPIRQVLQVIGTEELRGSKWHAAVLTRGFAEPQAWFALHHPPGAAGIEFPLEFEICQSVRAFGLGSFVLV